MSGTLGIRRIAIGRATARALPIGLSILVALLITGGVVAGLAVLVERINR